MELAVYVVLIYFMIFFIIGTILKNNSLVDIGWGLGFVVTAWTLFFLSGDFSLNKILLNILVSVWGLRLFYHIMRRNKFEEDFRYKKWRKDWGKWVIPRAFFQIYLFQGFFMFVVGLSANFVSLNGMTLSPWMFIGLLVWLIGFGFEVIGDRQLKQHIKNPANKGKLMTSGLWKHTRHPNYFGDAVMWWGIFIIAIIGTGTWYLVISPIVMTLLLRFISGVPILEKRMSKREGWEDYAAHTSAFIPFLKR